jgi:hypothetical protein
MFKRFSVLLSAVLILSPAAFAQVATTASAEASEIGLANTPAGPYVQPKDWSGLVAAVDSLLEKVSAGTGKVSITVTFEGEKVKCIAPVKLSKNYEVVDVGQKKVTGFSGKYTLCLLSSEEDVKIDYKPLKNADTVWVEPIVKINKLAPAKKPAVKKQPPLLPPPQPLLRQEGNP